MNFLPENYQKPELPSNYMKIVEGDNKVRVLSSAVVGYELWFDGKPKRQITPFTPEQEAKADMDTFSMKPKKQRHFWAFKVWNYEAKRPQILQITQKMIQDGINGIIMSDWGPPFTYDLLIRKVGQKKETAYQVFPQKPSDFPAALQAEADKLTVDLTALFRGEDPFATKEGAK